MKVLGGLVLYYSFMAQVLMASQSSSASDVNGDKRENFLNSLFNHFNLRVPESHQKDMLKSELRKTFSSQRDDDNQVISFIRRLNEHGFGQNGNMQDNDLISRLIHQLATNNHEEESVFSQMIRRLRWPVNGYLNDQSESNTSPLNQYIQRLNSNLPNSSDQEQNIFEKIIKVLTFNSENPLPQRPREKDSLPGQVGFGVSTKIKEIAETPEDEYRRNPFTQNRQRPSRGRFRTSADNQQHITGISANVFQGLNRIFHGIF